VVERGFDGLRYQDLADASSVPVASLRHYFPTIDGLRREALMHSVRTEMEQLAEHIARFDDPWQQVRELIIHSLGTTAAERRFSWLLWLEYWRNCARDEALARHSDQIDEEWTEMTQRIVDAGVEAGQFVLDQPPHDAAYEVTILIDGVGLAIAIDPEDEELASNRVRHVTRAARRLLGISVEEAEKGRSAENRDV
jgi:AcrR family transcriptional regulator